MSSAPNWAEQLTGYPLFEELADKMRTALAEAG